MIGAKTIGNSTLIAFDDKPLFVTDPWLKETVHISGAGSFYHIPVQEADTVMRI